MQAQEEVGVKACLGPLHKLQKGPDSLTFCLSLSASPLQLFPHAEHLCHAFPQEIPGPGWQPEQGAKAGSEGFQVC